MNKVVALINLHDSNELGLLTLNRPIASTTFFGRYAFIDFALSNLSNSGIDQVGILVKNHSRSIIKHLGGKNTYLRNPKTGFQSIFLNERGLLNPDFNTDIHNIQENDWFLYDNDVKYIVVCPCNILMHVDYNDIVREHIKFNRKISVMVTDVKNADAPSLHQCERVVVDSLSDVQKFDTNDGNYKEATVSLETYVFNADFLRDILKTVNGISQMLTIKSLVKYLSSYTEKVHAIKFKGMFKRFASMNDYFNHSMQLINEPEKARDLFRINWPIYTLTHNTRPVLYGEKSNVSTSLIANGCTIDGTVKHSILSRDVTIEEGSSVENCIIFTNSHISKGVHLKNCIVDKHTKIDVVKDIEGTEEKPLYIPQGAKI